MQPWLIILLLISVAFIVFSTTKLKLHPFLALIFAALGFGILAGMPLDEVVESVSDGFGRTLGSIGIVIVAGIILGTFLEKSGGAFTLADSVLKLTKRKNVPLAMAIIGYIVAIPVFCDSGFVILSPLNKALTKKAGMSLAVSAIALSLGLYATHTMVPPTPGPIAAAGLLEADLGLVIVWGLAVSIPALLIGWLFALRFGSRTYIDPEPEFSEAEINQIMQEGPSALQAFLPIAIPIVLILAKSIADYPTNPLGEGFLQTFVSFVGNPLIALLIGVLISWSLPKKFNRELLSDRGWVGKALLDSAAIILITGAGGAFGRVLQNSGIAEVIGKNLAGGNLGIFLPFIISSGIKTAQGSSTVAIVTTATLLAPLLGVLNLDAPIDRALTVVAIGAGAMVVSHANDSYFWVVSQFSRMTTEQAFKLQTLGTLTEGVAAGIIVWIISLVT
ncbi:putative D-glycerate permease [Gloeocapsa sp. PCC 7428]|uniref:GntP family permease n=1 Tax=Gloeocapsa sp. PCC 7428 TaxID=1173026 RepID=UPI0002A5DB5A|nr:GntP family permease [Gloeocapsa sp. PCC 7428]AFZ32593.1 putative D-glycerate permease [Gloeocapsa sp. PCC 7428]